MTQQTDTQTLLDFAGTLEGNAGAVIRELMDGLSNNYLELPDEDWIVDLENPPAYSDLLDFYIKAQQALAKAAALVGGEK